MLKQIILSFALSLSVVACIGAPESGDSTPDQSTDKTEAVVTSDEALTTVCPVPVACVRASRLCKDGVQTPEACEILGLCCSCYENFC